MSSHKIVVRRVKCDETLPFCRRCTSTGRQCEGYQPPSSDSAPSSDHDLPFAHLIPRSPSLEIPGTAAERRSFAYFQERIASQLSGFYGESFWDVQVLRATYHEPCIRHAIIALGSLYEGFESAPGVGNRRVHEFALGQYGIAIRELLGPFLQGKEGGRKDVEGGKGSKSLDVCLISCVIFSCFEVSGYPSGVKEEDGG